LISRAEPNSGFDQKLRGDGGIKIRAIVNVDGSVSPVAVTHEINPVLDQAALDAVKKWKFEPARLVGFPVAMTVTVEVKFHSH
jgi:periplasmic protein TonB